MSVPRVGDLKIKIFADGADLESIRAAAADPRIKGFTTNPTLMRAAGVDDYKAFALEVLGLVADRPISFEVFADDFPTMADQAREIASWGANVYVKIPVTNTKGEFSGPLIAELSHGGIKLNVTAVMTLDQVARVGEALSDLMRHRRKVELLWASPRELLNIFQANEIGCHIITVTGDVLKKLTLVGMDLEVYSRDTVAMFYKDAAAAGYQIPIAPRPGAVAS
jgi:transaldolase